MPKKRAPSVLRVGTDVAPKTLAYKPQDDFRPQSSVSQTRSYSRSVFPISQTQKNYQNPKIQKNLQNPQKLQKEKSAIDEASRALATFRVQPPLHSNDNRFAVPFSVASSDQSISILIDSGAGGSFIKRDVVERLQFINRVRFTSPRSIKGALGQSQTVAQTVSIPLNSGTWKGCVTFYVLNDLPEEAIVGLPFIIQNEALISFKERTFAGTPHTTKPMPMPTPTPMSILTPTPMPETIKTPMPTPTLMSILTPTPKPETTTTPMSTPTPTSATIKTPTSMSMPMPMPMPINNITWVDHDQYLREIRPSSAEIGLLTVQLLPTDVDDSKPNPDAAVNQLLNTYANVVTNKKPSTIPDFTNLTHEIHLEPGTTAPARPPYRMSAAENEILHKELQELLQQGAIIPSTSPFAAPVLFVKKKDGSLRLCVDYRLLNQQTIRNKFPLPAIDDLLDSLGGAQWFSKLDLMSGYHQIRIEPQDEHKTAFSTRWGHYQFRVMPFGLTNAPATFQSFMNHILAPFLNKFVVVYLDDILIFSRTKEEHFEHVRAVLDVLKSHKLIAKKSKCQFFCQQTTFLGFHLSNQGILPIDDKISIIRDFPKPSTPKNAMSFMGLANFYRRFIKDFSKIAGPINQYMSGKTSWSTSQDNAFNILKDKLISAPILAIPDLTKDFVLTTDASQTCVGATLEQRNSDGSFAGVIGYFSKRLQGSQLNYSAQEQEFLGIIEALRQYRHLLIGKHFTLRTDHYSLTFLMMQSKTPQRRIARWLDTLAEYDFSIEHIKGTQNTAADALSRIHLNALALHSIISEDFKHNIKQQLPSDAYFGLIYNTLLDDTEEPNIPKEIRHYIKHYQLIDGLLYFSITVGSDNDQLRMCIPNNPQLRKTLMSAAHDPPTSGHFGPYKTYFSLAQNCYWPHMFKSIQRYIKSCDTCQRCKTGTPGTDGLLKPLDIPENRWSSVSLDFVTGLPKSNNCDAILVVVDRLTKRSHFIPTVKEIDAPLTARLFMQNIVKLHGVPKTVVSDRDIRFVSAFWRSLHNILGSQLQMSTSNHPQTDGQTERVNRILNNLLRSYCYQEHDTWTNYLDMVEFAYNSSYQKSIDTTPFMADLGYQPTLPLFRDLSLQPNYHAGVEDLGTKLKAIQTRIQDQMAHAQRSQEFHANSHRNDATYNIGDWVLVHRETYAKSDTYKKIQPAYLGPFKVVKKITDNVYEIDLPDHRKTHRCINVQFLRPYHKKDSYPKKPPTSEKEAFERVHEIIGIAGYDQEKGTWDLQWQDCPPELISTVSDDFMQTYVPDEVQESIMDNLQQLLQNRDDSL